jgi:hypothetical protein
MPSLHDTAYRSQIIERIRALRPNAERRWGKMTVDQMLWHVSDAMALSLGEMTIPPGKPPLPRGLLKFIVLNLPWAKNGPTHPAFVAARQYDFETERVRCLRLVEVLAAKNAGAEWPVHPMFGGMTGSQVARLHAKHLNHHLTQFGV